MYIVQSNHPSLEKSGWTYWGQYGSWLAATSAYQKRGGPCRQQLGEVKRLLFEDGL